MSGAAVRRRDDGSNIWLRVGYDAGRAISASRRRLVLLLVRQNGNMINTLSGAIGAGLRCRCPRCGKGKLFTGFLKLRPRCEVCGLDYGFADSGDGPAVFIMFLAGAIVVGAALVTEVLFQPPYWVHAALWLPLIALVTLGPLRPMKGLMIALQHHHKAEERRFGGS